MVLGEFKKIVRGFKVIKFLIVIDFLLEGKNDNIIDYSNEISISIFETII